MSQNLLTLFETFKMGDLELSNRIVMAPMTRMRADPEGTPQEMMTKHYSQRASAGLIITEATYISPTAKGYPIAPGIVSERHINGWKNVVDAVHSAGGKIALQLWHAGRVSHSSFIGHGSLPVAPSAVAPTEPCFTLAGMQPYETPRALTLKDISTIIKEHVQAAEVAMKIGFDAVEIHGANGYLLDQFLRDGSNQRTDKYGGDIENRARLLIETTKAVSDAIGKGRVGVRLSPFNPANSMSDSSPYETYSYTAEALGKLGLAFLHVTRMGVEKAEDLAFDIAELGKIFNGPVMLNGAYTAESGAEAISTGKADLISFGTPYTSNPDLVERFRTGQTLTNPDPNAFYSGGDIGYTDFKAMEAAEA